MTESAVPPQSRFRRVLVETTDAAARSVIPQLPGPRLHRCLIIIVILFYFIFSHSVWLGRSNSKREKKKPHPSGSLSIWRYRPYLLYPRSSSSCKPHDRRYKFITFLTPLHQLLTIFVFSHPRLFLSILPILPWSSTPPVTSTLRVFILYSTSCTLGKKSPRPLRQDSPGPTVY